MYHRRASPRYGYWSRGRSRSRSRNRSRSRSRSRSRDRRSRERPRVIARRRRSPSRDDEDEEEDRTPGGRSTPTPEGQEFETTIIVTPSPRLRRRRRMTASEPPQYPYHPNDTVMIANDVTSVSYIMDGRCTILGDGKLHKVTIAILPFNAMIHHVITPRISFDAYLQVSLTYSYLLNPPPPH